MQNLTTAATVWASASIGLLVTAGLWLVATGAAVAIIAVLELQPISYWIYGRGDRMADRRAAAPAETAAAES